MSTGDPPAKPIRPGWPSRPLVALLSMTCMLLAVGWLASIASWREVAHALQQANLAWVLAAVGVNLLALPFWALSVRELVPKSEPRSIVRILEVLSIDIAATQILSTFAGAATGLVLLVRHAGLSKAGAMAVVALEQLTSGLVKLVLIGAALLWATAPGELQGAGLSLLIAMALTLTGALGLAHAHSALARMPDTRGEWVRLAAAAASRWSSKLEALRRPGKLLAAVSLGVCRRGIEAAAALCLQQAFGLPVSVELALLIAAALAVATIIPGPPGNLGIYEAAVVFAYGVAGHAADIAVAIALLQHLAYLVASVLPGALVLASGRVLRSSPSAP